MSDTFNADYLVSEYLFYQKQIEQLKKLLTTTRNVQDVHDLNKSLSAIKPMLEELLTEESVIKFIALPDEEKPAEIARINSVDYWYVPETPTENEFGEDEINDWKLAQRNDPDYLREVSDEANDLIAQYVSRQELKTKIEAGLKSVVDDDHKAQLEETLVNITTQLNKLLENDWVAHFIAAQSETSAEIRNQRIERLKTLVPIYFH